MSKRKYKYIYHQIGDEAHKFDKTFEKEIDAKEYGWKQKGFFRILREDND